MPSESGAAMNDSIYIVIINYNGFEDTIECIKSLKHSNVPNVHVVVVDNCSTDDSCKKLSQCGLEFELIKSKSNGGFSYGNNIGIRYCIEHKADYILFLNNDTVVEPDFLEPLIETSKALNNKAAISGKILFYDKPQQIWYAGGIFNNRTGRIIHIGSGQMDDTVYNEEKRVSYLSGCMMFMHASVIEKCGLWDESFFLYCEDLDYSCRLLKNGIAMIYNPSSVIYHKVNSSTSKISGLSTYYTIRNKLYCLDTYTEKRWKPYSRLVFYMETIKRVIRKRYDLKNVIEGIGDYRKRIYGKR